MNCRKIAAVSVAAALALAAAGCGSDDSQADGGRRSRAPARPSFSFGRKNDAVAQLNQDRKRQQANRDLGALNPETSMERDMKRLKASETAQLKRVEELRGTIDQRSDLVRREEEKLADIQKRIQDYDVALQRYDMAAKARPPREFGGETAVVPDEMFHDRPVQSSRSVAMSDPNALGASQYNADYHDRMRQLPPRDISAAAPPADYQMSRESLPPRNEFQPLMNVTTRALPSAMSTQSGETLLYRSGEEPRVINSANYNIGEGGLTPVPVNVTKPAPPSPSAGKPFAGAPVGRVNQTLTTRSATASAIPANPEEEWRPEGNLFSNSKAAPSVQPYVAAGANASASPPGKNAAPRQDQGREEELWGNPEPVRIETAKPAAPKPSLTVPAAKAAPSPAPTNYADEVFTPDLFLSR